MNWMNIGILSHSRPYQDSQWRPDLPYRWHGCTDRGSSRSSLVARSRWGQPPFGRGRSTSDPALLWGSKFSWGLHQGKIGKIRGSSSEIDQKFKTNLNIKTLLCILISVMDEGGNECATATKPTLGSDVLQFGQNVKIDQFILIVNRLFIKFWVKPCLFVWEL